MEENKNKENEKEKERIALGLGFIRGYKKKVDNTPKVEAKAEYRNQRAIKTWRYNNLVLIVLIFSVIFVVAMLIYALFTFFHGSRLANIAGVHFSDNLKEAYHQIMSGKNVSEVGSVAGYENWLTYRCDAYEVKYPEGWELKDEDYLTVRKFNKKAYGYFDSLAAEIKIKQLENPENLEIVEYLKKNNLQIGAKKEEMIGGRNALRTGIFKGPMGFTERAVYWPMEGKVLFLEAIFYNNNYEDLFGDYEKIVQSVTFS